jgi:hypothetical protein
LMSIEVNPPGQTVFVGNTVPFTATGIYSDNTTADLTNDGSVTWTISGAMPNAVATVSAAPAAGYVTGVGAGMRNVVAHYINGGTNVTGQTAITVSPATVTSLAVTGGAMGAVGVGTQMTAMATTTGGMIDVTGSAIWATSDANVATVSAAGLVTGVAPGMTTISAIYQGVASTTNVTYTTTMAVLSSLTITAPVASTPKGIAVDYVAIGHYSDGSVVDHTTDVALSWGSDNMVAIGLHTGHAVTTAATVGAVSNITASITVGGIMKSAATTLTISPVTLLSITVSRAQNANISVGSMGGLMPTNQFTATGNLSDGNTTPMTTSVTWTSSDGNVATVANAGMVGLVTAKAAGTTTITAIDPVSGFTGMLNQTVVP